MEKKEQVEQTIQTKQKIERVEGTLGRSPRIVNTWYGIKDFPFPLTQEKYDRYLELESQKKSGKK